MADSDSGPEDSGSEGTALLNVNCGEFTVKLTFEGSVNILTVKEAIKDKIGIDVERQTLYSDFEFSEELTDDKTIVPSGNVICLSVQPLPADATIKVTVSHFSTDYQQDFEVKETDTVISLKRKIRSSPQFTRMITKNQVHEKPEYVFPQDLLLIRKENVPLLVDEDQLNNYCIHDGCKIEVHISIIDRDGPDLRGSFNTGGKFDQKPSTSNTSESVNKPE